MKLNSTQDELKKFVIAYTVAMLSASVGWVLGTLLGLWVFL